MKRPIVVVVAVLALAAIGGTIWFFWTNAAQQATEALGGSGTIEAQETIISAQTQGRILHAPFAEGNPVKKGQLLYQLDATLANDQVRQAQAGLRAANAQLKQVKDDSASTNADIAAARAQVDQATIAVNMARTQAGFTTVTAPVPGTATNKVADVGENAAPGGTLAIIADTLHLTVTIYVPETEIGKVKLGQTGKVVTDGSTREYPGTVTFISSQAEFTPASVETKDQRVKLVYQVKLAVDNTDGSLKPGMPADVTF
jgi:HlyD family secretion protein